MRVAARSAAAKTPMSSRRECAPCLMFFSRFRRFCDHLMFRYDAPLLRAAREDAPASRKAAPAAII